MNFDLSTPDTDVARASIETLRTLPEPVMTTADGVARYSLHSAAWNEDAQGFDVTLDVTVDLLSGTIDLSSEVNEGVDAIARAMDTHLAYITEYADDYGFNLGHTLCVGGVATYSDGVVNRLRQFEVSDHIHSVTYAFSFSQTPQEVYEALCEV